MRNVQARIATAALFLLSAMCSSPGVQAEDTNGEQTFKEQMGLADYQRVEYRDAKGQKISYAEFQKLMPDFPSFGMEKTKKDGHSFAVVKLQAEEVQAVKPAYKIKPGAPFPAFKLHATDGSLVDSAALRGRYYLISFYFSECAPCVKEVPMLNAFSASHKDVGVLAVTFDSAQEAKGFAQKTGLGWRTIADGKRFIDKIGVQAYPTLALVNPQGMLVATGNQSEVDVQGGKLDAWVDQLVSPSSAPGR